MAQPNQPQTNQQTPKATKPPPQPAPATMLNMALDPELAAELEADKLSAEQEVLSAGGGPARSPDVNLDLGQGVINANAPRRATHEDQGSHLDPSDNPHLAAARASRARAAAAPPPPPMPVLPPLPPLPVTADPVLQAVLEQNRLLTQQLTLLLAQGAAQAFAQLPPVHQIRHKNAPTDEQRAHMEELKSGAFPPGYTAEGYRYVKGMGPDDAKIEYARVVRMHWELQQNGKPFIRYWD